MSETLGPRRIPLDDYAELLAQGEIEELRALGVRCAGGASQMSIRQPLAVV